MKARLLQLITGKDNSTFDMGRVSWALSFMALLLHEGWQVAHGSGSSARDFAFSLAAISAAHGLAIGAKASTEPTGEQP